MIGFESTGTVISSILNHVDMVGANLVARSYHNLVNHYSPLFYTLTTIYMSFIFLKMKRGLLSGNDLLMIVLRTVMILSLAMNYDLFCLYIYDIFTVEPLTICQAITVNGGTVKAVSISHSLDNFLNAGEMATNKIYSMGSWTNPTYYIFGFSIHILTLITTAIATSLIILAKCASTLLLSLSPIFIFFALFDATKGLFESYLQQLIAYALLPIMACAVLMILLSVSDVTIQLMNSTNKPTYTSLIPFSLMCVIQIYLLLQVKGACAALASGIHLPNVISTLRQAKNDYSGVASGATNLMAAMVRGSKAALPTKRTSLVMRSSMNRFSK